MFLLNLSVATRRFALSVSDGHVDRTSICISEDRQLCGFAGELGAEIVQCSEPFPRFARSCLLTLSWVQHPGDSVGNGARIGVLVFGLPTAFAYRHAEPVIWPYGVAMNVAISSCVKSVARCRPRYSGIIARAIIKGSGNQLIEGASPRRDGKVGGCPRLGGLLNHHERAA